jgi:hypothetical protein
MERTTNCSRCDNVILYNEDKPSLCSWCIEEVTYANKGLEQNIYSWLYELFQSPDYNYITNGYYSWLPSESNLPMHLDFLVYKRNKMLFAIDIIPKDCTVTKDEALKERYMKHLGVPLIKIKREAFIDKDSFIKLLAINGITTKNLCAVC